MTAPPSAFGDAVAKADAAPRPHIDAEVAYAAPQRSVLKTFRLTVPATVAQVLKLAAADGAFAGIDLERCAVGVFGHVTPRDQLLNHGDRVEIYRPLAADPKTARRARARQASRIPAR